ncbi:MAG TPA: hypothetical protein PK655_03335 [archaeon]|jgi:hypothetical protein|nr:hypothetical protein [archaeon]HPV66457.1 hypothetical protein [archaeon]HRS42702.1 hypothetical protein [Candidatus Diapherotrites archaeon]
MVAKNEEQDYNLDDFDYDGDECIMEEKEDIDTEYTPDDFDDEDEEEYDSDQDYSDD